jgi:hypothetical protein
MGFNIQMPESKDRNLSVQLYVPQIITNVILLLLSHILSSSKSASKRAEEVLP